MASPPDGQDRHIRLLATEGDQVRIVHEALIRQAVDEAYDEAKKAYDNPEEYAEEKADELLDTVSDWFSDDDEDK